MLCGIITGWYEFNFRYNFSYSVVLATTGFTAGVTYTYGLISIRQRVHPNMRIYATSLICAFRLASPVLKNKWPGPDSNYLRGSMIMFMFLIPALLVAFYGPKKDEEDCGDDDLSTDNESWSPSWSSTMFHIITVLGTRIPNILIRNFITQTIFAGFIERLSEAVLSKYWIITTFSIITLLFIASSHSLAKQLYPPKLLILPALYAILAFSLLNIPFLFIFFATNSDLSLVIIILLNLVIDIVSSPGLLLMIDLILVHSNLSSLNISLVIAFEFIALTSIEYLSKLYGNYLEIITLQGYYAILAVVSLIPLLICHKFLPFESLNNQSKTTWNKSKNPTNTAIA